MNICKPLETDDGAGDGVKTVNDSMKNGLPRPKRFSDGVKS
jgi:hypothetical protein